tara:strand:+ start:199 stop:408 length:210 start_codon:yes stop_codon:yes gene_type:complete
MELIQIMLPGTQVINGTEIQCEKMWDLSLNVVGDKIDVHFWKPSTQENGKHFIRIAKADKAKFLKAVKG